MINPVFSKEHPRLIFKEIILKSKLKKKKSKTWNVSIH